MIWIGKGNMLDINNYVNKLILERTTKQICVQRQYDDICHKSKKSHIVYEGITLYQNE